MVNKQDKTRSLGSVNMATALGLPALVGVMLMTGCSKHEEATTVTAVTSTAVENAGGSETDAARKLDCHDLVWDITLNQRALSEHGAEWYKDAIPDIVENSEKNPNNSELAARHADEAVAIAVESVPDPHSKAVKQKVKDFCGSEFDNAVSKTTEAWKKSKYGKPFTPDWSL